MSKRLDGMRRGPHNDWKIKDVEGLCSEFEIRCIPPTGGGSHFKVSHPSQREILTVPKDRPIKPIYIRKLVKFVDAVRIANELVKLQSKDTVDHAAVMRQIQSVLLERGESDMKGGDDNG